MVVILNNKKRFSRFAKSLRGGFTLIELLIVTAIFSILMVAVVGVFVSIVKIQRHTLAVQQLLDQTSYVMERVSRMTRMAKKDINGSCTSGASYEKTSNSLKFIDYNDNCRRFYLNGTQNDQVYEDITGASGYPLPLTSNNVKITKFDFFVQQGSGKQPRVTIILEAESANLIPSPKIKLQTTVSQRLINQ